jgi:predicted transcriptional regulator
MQKIESWPEEAQELAAIAQEMDEALRGGIYQASQDELAGIDRGLKAAREGRFAKDADVEAALSKRRP